MVETSIVIRSFNEAKFLPALLSKIRQQNYKNYEIILVDSGSYDASRDIARSYNAQVIEIDKHDFTFGFSLNVGIKAAIGQYIVLVSAHTEPLDNHWLENMIAPLKLNGKVAMTYGRQLGTGLSKFSEINDLHRLYGKKDKLQIFPDFFANNANSALKKSFWVEKIFDESLAGLEDIDWAKYWVSKGYMIQYCASAAIYHIHEETWGQIKRRSFREAIALKKMELKSRRHIFSEFINEFTFLLTDFLLLFQKDTRSCSFFDKVKEVFFYRCNKLFGSIEGLLSTQSSSIMTYQDRLVAYFDKGNRSVIVRSPNTASVEYRPFPDLKPADVLIRTAYVGVCSTDLEVYKGELGYYKNGIAKYPIVPGHEFSGRIVGVGANVVNLEKDDRVVVECIQSCGLCEECKISNFIACIKRTEVGVMNKDGAYSDYIVYPARFVHKVPASISLQNATLVEPLAVLLKGLKRVGLYFSNLPVTPCRIIILGAGPLGHLCARLLKTMNYEVCVYDRSVDRCSRLIEFGIEAISELKDLKKYDVLIEITGSTKVLEQILLQSRAGARVLLLGFPYGNTEFNFESIVGYDKTVVGSVGSSAEEFSEALKILSSLPLDDFFTATYSIFDFKKAWHESCQLKNLKILIDLSLDVDSKKI